MYYLKFASWKGNTITISNAINGNSSSPIRRDKTTELKIINGIKWHKVTCQVCLGNDMVWFPMFPKLN